jgi:hypothetical protein
MEIEVWSVGKTKFTADPEYQEPMIREALDQRGGVAEAVLDYTDSQRSDISHDEYARVTGDVPGLVLFEGWLTGDPDAPPPAEGDDRAAEVLRLRELVAEMLADFWGGERFTGISEGLRDAQARVDGYRERAGLEAQQ